MRHQQCEDFLGQICVAVNEQNALQDREKAGMEHSRNLDGDLRVTHHQAEIRLIDSVSPRLQATDGGEFPLFIGRV